MTFLPDFYEKYISFVLFFGWKLHSSSILIYKVDEVNAENQQTILAKKKRRADDDMIIGWQ